MVCNYSFPVSFPSAHIHLKYSIFNNIIHESDCAISCDVCKRKVDAMTNVVAYSYHQNGFTKILNSIFP